MYINIQTLVMASPSALPTYYLFSLTPKSIHYVLICTTVTAALVTWS